MIKFIKNIINKIGFHTKRKLIVFLSDDWGGVRIRSNEVRQNLMDLGIDMDSNRFDRFDTLESNDDLELLFEVLLKHKDYKGNHPVITAVTNVANPDFKKIRESGFSQYFYEPFTKTLERYPNHDRVFGLYKKGIELNIFRPELHGREHLQVNWWLENLQSGNEMVRKTFDDEFWYLPVKYITYPMNRDLASAYDIFSQEEIRLQGEIVADGAQLFETLFGYRSILFIPPAQHFHKNLEQAIASAGFRMIDVPRLRNMPLGQGRFSTKFHYLGQKNKLGIRYLTRNVVFEPNMSKNNDCVDYCLAGIESVISAGKPAVISNHRTAFVGGIDLKNREKGLKALDKLISEILKRWPDMEFLNAAELFQLIAK